MWVCSFLSLSLPHCLRQGLSLNLELDSSGSEHQGSARFCPFGAGIIGTVTIPAFYVFTGDPKSASPLFTDKFYVESNHKDVLYYVWITSLLILFLKHKQISSLVMYKQKWLEAKCLKLWDFSVSWQTDKCTNV